MPAVRASVLLENLENLENRNKTADVQLSKNRRFLARKMHKLKKILKMSSNLFHKRNAVGVSDASLEEWQNHQNSIEEQMQNYENELVEKKLSMERWAAADSSELDQNLANENWENWDSCYMCAHARAEAQAHVTPSHNAATYAPQRFTAADVYSNCNSVCYVFMPGQTEPVPVKLRNARIPGGVMWIVYRPDLDLSYRDNLYEITRNQLAQAQRPIVV